MATPSEKQKFCFVVGPIGDDESEDRVHADWLLEDIIFPVFNEHYSDFQVKRADKISDPGRIDTQVIDALLNADLVVADLTTLNPNAFYEIGIRHTIQKPIIHMHLEGQRIPFDIASFRSIKFSRKWPRDIRAAREALREAVAAVLADGYRVDNPVTFSRGKVEFEKTATPGDLVMLDELQALKRRMSNFEDYMVSSAPRWASVEAVGPRVIRLAIAFSDGATSEEIQEFISTKVFGILPTISLAAVEPGRAVLTLDAQELSSEKLKRLSTIASDAGLTITSIMYA